MNYQELIHDFLDNSLAGANEETLFHALASDEELRFEFKYLLSLRNAVQSDKKAFVPPAASVNKLFAQLGYTAPGVATGAAGALSATKGLLQSFMHSAMAVPVSLAVGALMSAGVFMALDTDAPAHSGRNSESGANIAVNDSAQPDYKLPHIENVSADETAAPARTEAERAGQRQAATANSGTRQHSDARTAAAGKRAGASDNASGRAGQVLDGSEWTDNRADNTLNNRNDASASAKTAPVNASAENFRSTAPLREDDADLARKDAENPAQQALADKTANVERSAPEQLFEVEPVTVLVQPSALRPRMERNSSAGFGLIDGLRQDASEQNTVDHGFMFRALNSYSFPAPSVASSANSGPEDFVLGYRIGLWENGDIILEGGREAYYQEFSEIRPGGVRYTYKQNPLMYWGGIGYRQWFGNVWNFQPYAQALLGVSQGGGMGRLLIGADYAVGDNVRLMFGLETSLMWYSFNNQTELSRKVGLSYGVSFTF